jgi:hypothetical protein
VDNRDVETEPLVAPGLWSPLLHRVDEDWAELRVDWDGERVFWVAVCGSLLVAWPWNEIPCPWRAWCPRCWTVPNTTPAVPDTEPAVPTVPPVDVAVQQGLSPEYTNDNPLPQLP